MHMIRKRKKHDEMQRQNICTFVFTGNILSEITLPWCLPAAERGEALSHPFSLPPFQAFSAFHQLHMAFLSALSLVVFSLVRNIRISNFLFTDRTPASLQVQPQPVKGLWFCKKQLWGHCAVL